MMGPVFYFKNVQILIWEECFHTEKCGCFFISFFFHYDQILKPAKHRFLLIQTQKGDHRIEDQAISLIRDNAN